MVSRRLVARFAFALIGGGVVAAIWLSGRGRESGAPGGERGPASTAALASPTPYFYPWVLVFQNGQLTQLPIHQQYASIIPLRDGSMLAGDIETRSWRVVRRDGTSEPRLPATYQTRPVPSNDERKLAWPGEEALLIYDRAAGSLRAFESAKWVVGRLAWSPDDGRIAYLRLTGDNVVHMIVLDTSTGIEREVYADEPDEAISDLRWNGEDGLEFRTYRGASCCTIAGGELYLPDQGGRRYVMRDDGGNRRVIGEGNPLWGKCGPTCGLPPAGYERADGTVSWEVAIPDGFVVRWGIVDRTAGTVRVMPRGEDSGSYAVSPDGTRVAYVICDFKTDQLLRIVRLDDMSMQDVTLPPLTDRVCYNVHWFPDGESLVLSFAWDDGP